MVLLRCIIGLLALGAAAALDPPKGTYAVRSKVYHVPALDSTNQQLHVYWPADGQPDERFPLVSYMHGMSGGGPVDIVAYHQLFMDMAAFGLVIVAPGSCGALSGKPCNDPINAPYTDCAGILPVRPPGWGSYYGEGLKALEWAKNQSDVEPGPKIVNWTVGVGVCGHSMGGQATTLAAGAGCAKQWDIRAAAIHHAAYGGLAGGAGNIGVNVSVPLAAFTTSGDGCCEASTFDIYTNATVKAKVYRDQVGFSHMEPLKIPIIHNILNWYNPWLAPMTVAWFKIYLEQDPTGIFHSMIYNSSDPASLCNYAGPSGMARCEALPATE